MIHKQMIHLSKGFGVFLREMMRDRRIIIELAKKDFKSRYLGSYFGLVWAFVQPVVTILILWFVFSYGLKIGSTGDRPMVLWLIAALVPWFFFTEALAGGSNSIVENSYLIKKVYFRASFLPIVKVLSALLIHLIFLVATLAIFTLAGFPLTLHSLQLIYYIIGHTLLLLGLSWLTSSLAVFTRDVGQVVSIVVQLGFWVTPIVWPLERVPGKFQVFFKLNPVYYIVAGYRESLVSKVWLWEHWKLGVYFWCFTLAMFVLGAIVFKRLRPHFADVL